MSPPPQDHHHGDPPDTLETRYEAEYPGLVSSWDQRTTLQPPPYKFAWRRHVERGLYVGDPEAHGRLADEDLMSGHPGYSTRPSVPSGEDASPLAADSGPDGAADPEFLDTHEPPCFLGDLTAANPYTPTWVDFESVRRGQRLWNKHLLRASMSLGMSLLVGLSVARFSEILEFSGYSSSPMAAIYRYRQTFFRWLDWFRFEDVTKAGSRFRKSCFAVRRVHEFVRRQVAKAKAAAPSPEGRRGAARRCGFVAEQDDERLIGVPLSQYDVAEVQLVFSGLCISIFEAELSFGAPSAKLTAEDKRDMVHCWRFIGFLLGVQDEYNVCESVEVMETYLQEFLLFMPQRVRTARSSGFRLRDAAITGFGWWSGLGTGFYKGMFLLACESERLMGPKGRSLVKVRDSTTSPTKFLREEVVDHTDKSVFESSKKMLKSRTGASTCQNEGNKKVDDEEKENSMDDYTDCSSFGDVLWHRELVRLYLRYICQVSVDAKQIGKMRDLQFTDPERAWRKVAFNCKFARGVDFLFWRRLRLWAGAGGAAVLALGCWGLHLGRSRLVCSPNNFATKTSTSNIEGNAVEEIRITKMSTGASRYLLSGSSWQDPRLLFTAVSVGCSCFAIAKFWPFSHTGPYG